MSWLNFIKAPTPPTPLTNTNTIDQQYRYWRIRILYSMYAGYAFFYFTRKSFTFVTPLLITQAHISKTQIGLIASAFYIAYGFSKFISGILSDRANARYFMSLGLIITGITNIWFGLTANIHYFLALWVINGIFQGWGWPPCAKLLTHWYSQRERGRWWGAWNTCHNVGGALIPIIVGISAAWWGWQAAMIIPGILGIAMGTLLINRLRDTPESLGLPTVETYKNESINTTKQPTPSLKTILMKYVFNNRCLWILALSYVVIYVTRTAINDWGAVYLHENGYSITSADSCLSFFEVGGFLGSLAAGWLSDTGFKGRRGQTNTLFCIGTILAVLALWELPGHHYALHAAIFFGIGFFIFGPQMLIGVAAAELSHKKAAGASTGFIGLWGYLGAALSGYPIGLVITHWHWQGFFSTLILCAICSVLLLASLWSKRSYHDQTPNSFNSTQTQQEDPQPI